MGTVLTKMGMLPILVTLSAAAAFKVWLPGGLDGEEDVNATEKLEEYDEYDYYGYDDVLVPPSLPPLDLDENGFVPCQSKEQCPSDFNQTTTKVTYSCKYGLCDEELEEDLGIAGEKEVTHAALNAGTSFLSIGNPSDGVCHPVTCKRKGKCCLFITIGRGGKSFGCPPYC